MIARAFTRALLYGIVVFSLGVTLATWVLF